MKPRLVPPGIGLEYGSPEMPYSRRNRPSMHERQPERQQQPVEMIEVIEARYEQPLDHDAG